MNEPEPTYDRILDAAMELYARYGVEGVSLSLLADHVGVHKSTLFHHFRGKGELAEAALRRALEPICEIVDGLAAVDSEPKLDDLIEAAIRLDDHFARHPGPARFLLRAIVQPVDELDSQSGDFVDQSGPVMPIFLALGSWLERARRAGAIRPVRVRHALVNLLGLSLLYPAIVDDMGEAIFPGDPRASRSRRARREELSVLLRTWLAPDG